METSRVKIHLNRGGQSLGQFTPEEVRAGFREGRFTGADLAWRDGMPMWKPLSEVIDELAPEVAPAKASAAPALPTPEGFPWEQRARRGFFNALLETIRLVLLEPSKAFQSMPPVGGYKAPLFFLALCSFVALLVNTFYEVVLQAVGAGYPQFSEFLSGGAGISSLAAAAIVAVVAVFVLGVAVGLFVLSTLLGVVLTHLSLMILGAAKRPFETTFRVCCYATGATSILQMIPSNIGWILAFFWSIVAATFGLSVVNAISKLHALAAVLLPIFVCCVVFPSLVLGMAFALVGTEALVEALKSVQW
jgi:hypothetical protein